MTSPLAELAELSGIDEAALARLSKEDLLYLKWQVNWLNTARENQVPPDTDWTECGFQAGRGFGKTRLGAEWLGRRAWECTSKHPRLVIGPTFSDVRFTIFEGPSGLLNVIPPELIAKYNASDSFIDLTNGVTIRGFSSEKPERLRGVNSADIWMDEVAAWPVPVAQEVFDMAVFGLRLGTDPRILWTSTPKPIDIVRKLTKPKLGRIIVRGSSYDNKANLANTFFEKLQEYEGTDLGRQEIHGELIDPSESAIIKRSWFKLWPADKELPVFSLIVMSLDTAFTEATLDKRSGNADPTACLVAGVFKHEKKNNVMVLDAWDEQIGMPDLIRKIRKEMQNRFGGDEDRSLVTPLFGSNKPMTSGRAPDILLIEDKGSGISLRQLLASEGIVSHPYNPGRADKTTRLHIVSPVAQKKLIWLPESSKNPGQPSTWLNTMLDQLFSYSGPGTTRHDDYVDVFSQLLRLLMDMRLLEITPLSELEKVDRARTNDWEPEAPPKRVSNPYSA